MSKRNVEFKAELRDFEAAGRQCRQIQARYLGTLNQTDTYFKLMEGRLKRREAPGEPIEWVYYHREDGVQPRVSNYSLLTDEQARRRWGTESLREWLRVSKRRELWMLDFVRIHIDDVYRLGQFIEFEAMVGEQRTVEDCGEAVVRLREMFEPILGEPVAVSYCDLMALELAGQQ